MNKISLLSALGGLVIGGGMMLFTINHGTQSSHSPYVDQIKSPVRGLSAKEVEDLLTGQGAGYARSAELNRYPGPRHVLDLADELSLSTDQENAIQQVFAAMQAQAQQLGHTIVERERQLSQQFANGSMNSHELQEDTQTLAILYGQLRETHLQAHLDITPLLSPTQIDHYNQLRGYNGSKSHNIHQH